MPVAAEAILTSVRADGLLSFGPASLSFDLHPLNILIGPNASGKSNLIEIIGLLQAAPIDLQEGIRAGGGVLDWLWRGSPSSMATVEAVLQYADGMMPLRYTLAFTANPSHLDIVEERLENSAPYAGYTAAFRFFDVQNGHGAVSPRMRGAKPGQDRATRRRLQPDQLEPSQSVLSQRKDPDMYPEITYVGNVLRAFRLYREWSFGRNTAPRVPQPTDLPSTFLLSDASNLALVLNTFKRRGLMDLIEENLRQLYDWFRSIDTIVDGGRVQTYVFEKGLNSPIPATRMSDGTIRLLCLLAILCHPEPPRLICIEEPEVGLHPDVLPLLGRLLQEAAQRTQLVVTTHSERLVDCFTDTPDAVVVCEHSDHGTTFQRLKQTELKTWLDEYRLGHLWRKGVFGGNRW